MRLLDPPQPAESRFDLKLSPEGAKRLTSGLAALLGPLAERHSEADLLAARGEVRIRAGDTLLEVEMWEVFQLFDFLEDLLVSHRRGRPDHAHVLNRGVTTEIVVWIDAAGVSAQVEFKLAQKLGDGTILEPSPRTLLVWPERTYRSSDPLLREPSPGF